MIRNSDYVKITGWFAKIILLLDLECFEELNKPSYDHFWRSYLNIPLAPSVSLSHGWISGKRLKLGSCNFHHIYSSSIPLVFAGKVSSRNSDGILPSGGVKQGWGRENKLFSSFMRHNLDNGTRYEWRKLLLMTNRKSHMGFRLAPRSMTLDDLELDGGRPPLFSST